MAKLKYHGATWTLAGPDQLFVSPGEVVELPLSGVEVAELLATGDWEQLDDREVDGAIQLFISHSARDADLAQAIIELVERTLPLPRRAIRCTSVDGYRLRAGASIDETLRAEVQDAALVLALLTPNAMVSTYVMFEIGARWGSRKPMIPLLAAGLEPRHLKPPLNGIRAVDCADRLQVIRLVSEVAECLGITPTAAPGDVDVNRVVQVNRHARVERSLSHLTSELGEAAHRLGGSER